MRKHLAIALLEAEALEPRVQLAYARGEIPTGLIADVGLLRLLLERADHVSRRVFNQAVGHHYHIFESDSYNDRKLAESA